MSFANFTLKTFAKSLFFSALMSPAFAATLDVKLTNLTNSIYFTPVILVGHDDSIKLFEVGTMASDALEKMAEGGDIADLSAAATAAGGSVGTLAGDDGNGGATPFGPGTTVMVSDWDTGANTYLSLAGMLLPTNDGFVGLNSWPIPTEPGTYTVTLLGYDAGTEENNELILAGSGAPDVLGIPADPSGNSGTGGTGVVAEGSSENAYVHVHRGVLGDMDATGGKSDLSSAYHRWLNPVARLVVTVK